MVKQTTDGRSPDSDFETFHEGITGNQVALYRFGQSAETDCPPHEPAPLFLSGHDDEPDPREFTNLLRKRRPSVSSRILASVSVASAVAIMFALFSSDDMRKIVVDAKISIASMLPAPSAPAQPASNIRAAAAGAGGCGTRGRSPQGLGRARDLRRVGVRARCQHHRRRYLNKSKRGDVDYAAGPGAGARPIRA